MKEKKYCVLCGNEYEMDFGVKNKKRNICPVCGFTVHASNNKGVISYRIDKNENLNLDSKYVEMMKERGWFGGEE